jgi:hypothetical protein
VADLSRIPQDRCGIQLQHPTQAKHARRMPVLQ